MTVSENECGPLDRVVAEAVDAGFYAFAYGELPPGVTASGHYSSIGWQAGHDPNPWFSTQTYLAENADVAASGMVPLVHFLQSGAAEGRAIAPSSLAFGFYDRAPVSLASSVVDSSTSRRMDEAEAHDRTVVAAEFDEVYYLEVNPDVADAGVDPLVHFMQNGWREGRDPNAYFSVRRYLEVNVDVAEAGVNPFLHFLIAGKSEGRPLRLDLGFRYDVLAHLETVEERAAAVPIVPACELGSEMKLHNALTSLRRVNSRGLHLSVSHDDFTANVGGLQSCLMREAMALSRLDIDHVHLFPGRPLLVTELDDPNPALGVLVNGSPAGLFTARTIAHVFSSAFDVSNEQRSLAIHSCLGHSMEALSEILKALRIKAGYFWIHDFASLCAGYSLLRNDVEYCGAPPPTSAACELCIYGARRPAQVADHTRLFASLDLTAIAPSKSALDVWKAATVCEPIDAIVHPHCRFVSRVSDRVGLPRNRLRIAFLGYPNVHKGWPVFRELVRRFGRDSRFEFHHLGLFPERGFPVVHTEVAARVDSPAAMADAIESLDIDVALVWSIWPETFCFTAYEAIAGGAAVLAPAASGNVAAVVRETGKGIVLSDEEELYELFATGDIAALARSNRGVEHFSLEYSNMTADLIAVTV